MPQVKNQQSHSLHLILAYFIFVTTIFRLFLNFTILYFYIFTFESLSKTMKNVAKWEFKYSDNNLRFS